MGTFNNTVISLRNNVYCTRIFFFRSAWENQSYGKYYFGLVNVKGNSTQHDNLLYFELFLKSSVTSDYNEPNVSVTHVLCMIFYLSFLCVLWPPWLLGAGAWGGWDCTLCTTSLSIVRVFECGSGEALNSFSNPLLIETKLDVFHLGHMQYSCIQQWTV